MHSNYRIISDAGTKPMTIDDIILTACGQGADKVTIYDIVRRELSISGALPLWSNQEILKTINLYY